MIELGLLAGENVQLTPEENRLGITGICVDSRDIEPGSLFAAMPGVKVNGEQFVAKAIAKGAVAVLAGSDFDAEKLTVPVIRAEEPRLALAQMAARFYPRQPETIVAVTGTAGKTSVAQFLQQIWRGCGRKAAFIGTTGIIAPGRKDYGNLTTPDPVTLHRLLDELTGQGVDHLAMEASSHGLAQKRLHGVNLSAAGFTNLGRDHLDYHDDMEDYFCAKMRLFGELLPKGSPAVVFADDAYSARVAAYGRECGQEVLSVGRAGEFLCLKRVEHERYCQIADIVHDGKSHRVKFPLAGDFQISNALVAAGLALACGETIEPVMAQLEKLAGASGRLELVGKHGSGAPVYVDYAHKPDALENVLTSLRPFASGRLVLVFGCGGDRDPGKRPIMGEIAERLADKIIVTDDNPRTENAEKVRAAILAAAPSAIEIADRGEAIDMAVGELQRGDCLVVAGKGHETGQIVGDEVLEFSDHQQIKNVLEASR